MSDRFRLGHSLSSRWGWCLILALAAVIATGSVVNTSNSGGAAFAQEKKENGGEEAAPAEPPPDSAAESPADDERDSFLEWLIRANGWFFGPVLLLLSFIMVALVMINVLQVRRDLLLPPDFIEQFEQKLQAKDYQAAYELARSDESFVARVLAAGLSKLNRGYEEAIEGMQEVGEDENMHLEHRLSYLALIGSVAPMVGLMGTVWGMIDSFEEIASAKTAPPPSDLADGISTALFTTLEGLAIAIPAMIFYGLLRNRVARFVLEVGMISEGLMARFSQIGKGRTGGAASATAPAAPRES